MIRSGRAFLHPIYEGTYERRSKEPIGPPNERRDLKIRWVKDVRRSVDYLQSRRDIDPNRIAFYGLSLGAIEGPIFLSLENRLKTGVLLAGGYRARKAVPEVEPLNFAPRVKVPVLLLGEGRTSCTRTRQRRSRCSGCSGPPKKTRGTSSSRAATSPTS